MTTALAMNGPGGLGFDRLARVRADMLEHCIELERAFGDTVRYRLLVFEVLQFTHPEAVHAILGPKNASFVKPARMRQVLGQWNGNGLVLNEGESWARQRRLIAPAFRRRFIDRHVATFVGQAERLAATWAATPRRDVAPDLMRLTLRSVAESLFGAQIEAHEDAIVDAVAILNRAAMEEMTAPVVWPLHFPSPKKRRLAAAVRTLTGVVDRFIAARRAGALDGEDLLTQLLVAVDEEGDGGSMTDRQARDESVNLMLGGNETTATALIWALYLLATHPEAQAWLAEETRALEGPLDAATLERLPRTRAVFLEAMRLYPPAYVITREARADVEIAGHLVPRGAQVHVVPYIVHRDARWYPEPEAFAPERFVDADAPAPGTYLAFGAGPRACIGRAFAMAEGVAVLAALSRTFDFGWPEGAVMEREAQVSLHPKGGLELIVTPTGSAGARASGLRGPR